MDFKVPKDSRSTHVHKVPLAVDMLSCNVSLSVAFLLTGASHVTKYRLLYCVSFLPFRS